jgi:hypothetical protein
MLSIINNFASQFKFYDVLKVLNNSIITYLKNNSMGINFICIHQKTVKSTIYVITANLDYYINNGYRLITISTCENHDNNNIHLVNDFDSWLIQYENLTITIGSPTDNINNQIVNYNIQVTERARYQYHEIVNNTFNYYLDYGPNIKMSDILIAHANKNSFKYWNRFKKLETLVFDETFNENIPKFPKNIKCIKFTTSYNTKLLPNSIPLTVKEIIFGERYNTVIDLSVLPPTLEKLTFGQKYNQKFIKDALPTHLQELILGVNYNKLFENTLPNNLILLKINGCYNMSFRRGDLPKSLKTLHITGNFNQTLQELPNGLEELIFNGEYSCFNNDIKTKLPRSLKYLDLGNAFNKRIRFGILPDNLHTLKFGDSFTQQINRGTLSQNLHTLIFGRNFNKVIEYDIINNNMVSYLPEFLQVLKFGNLYNQIIYTLPPNLVILEFGKQYNQDIGLNILPNTLRELVFGDDFNSQIGVSAKTGMLPRALIKLQFGKGYKQVLNTKIIPEDTKLIVASW